MRVAVAPVQRRWLDPVAVFRATEDTEVQNTPMACEAPIRHLPLPPIDFKLQTKTVMKTEPDTGPFAVRLLETKIGTASKVTKLPRVEIEGVVMENNAHESLPEQGLILL